jgi:hypothetical protein
MGIVNVDYNSPPLLEEGDPIVFLDIDGVLNRHYFDILAGSNLIEASLVQIFNRILLKTKAKIVLSSAWRYIVYRKEANIIGIDWLLRSHGMVGRRLVGVTDEDTMVPHYDGMKHQIFPLENERGTQIQKWLWANTVGNSPYVVIDDGGFNVKTGYWVDLGINTVGHPVVWTDSEIGITHENADRAIAILEDSPNTIRYGPSPHVGRRNSRSMFVLPSESEPGL